MGFIPSENQAEIFSFTVNETGNGIVNAVAGSGKTTTILEALSLIPKMKQVLFLAFNKSIVEELKDRLPKDSPNVDVKTVHGFGSSAMIHAYKSNLTADKYRTLLNTLMPFWNVEPKNPDEFKTKVMKICDLGRLNLATRLDEIEEIALLHDIFVEEDECKYAMELIKMGSKNVKAIDFTDMVYLPNLLNLRVKQYDIVFIDECQDLNACQRELMLKAIKPGGRFIAVGDKNQAIYGFSGADAKSFEKLASLPNTKSLPLSVSYRCDKEIIKLAQTIVPQIQSRGGAPEGVVDHNALLKDIRDKDMILCRNTYPLVKLCLQFLSEGTKCYIVGRDIGTNLINMIKMTKQSAMLDVFERLYYELKKIKNQLILKRGLDEQSAMAEPQYVNYEEKVQVIKTIAEGLVSSTEVIKKIEQIFSDDNKEGIKLSTIHKSKGLESDRVFIIHKDLMPAKYAQKIPWMLEQEHNLMYVAYTRAKHHLGFISDFNAYSKNKSRLSQN